AQKGETKARVAQIQQAQEIDARDRQERLRRALATQRARFGAQGVSSSGSSNAVLEGLAAEANREQIEANALAETRIQQLGSELASAQRKNLLAAVQPYNRLAFSALQRNLDTHPLLEA
ncbi:MAG: hypothetical protein RKL24_13830, partial [Defluviicoccus sp.]|nr:hypothetical protein [Defluviicoccus sp.]